MTEVVGSLLEIFRSEDAVDVVWSIRGSDTWNLVRGRSPPFSFAGGEFKLRFERDFLRSDSSPLVFRLCRLDTPSSPSPLVRYWLGAVKGDGGREVEEIGRGRRGPGDSGPLDHPWLSLPELQRRMGYSSSVLSVVVRLRTGPETVSIQNDASACDVSRGLESLSSDLSKMLDDETTSDVKLTCKLHSVFAHKTILAARSDVFAAMFRNKMAESETGVVNLFDMDVSVFELFVKYLYSGKVLDLSEDNVSGLYDAADVYAVHELKEECSRWIRRNLTERNCFGFLILAEAHGDQATKDAVLDYFLKNVHLLNSEMWNSFSEQHPKLSICIYQKCVSEKNF